MLRRNKGRGEAEALSETNSIVLIPAFLIIGVMARTRFSTWALEDPVDCFFGPAQGAVEKCLPRQGKHFYWQRSKSMNQTAVGAALNISLSALWSPSSNNQCPRPGSAMASTEMWTWDESDITAFEAL